LACVARFKVIGHALPGDRHTRQPAANPAHPPPNNSAPWQPINNRNRVPVLSRSNFISGGTPCRRPFCFGESVRDGGTPSLPHYNGARFCSRNFCCWRSNSFCSPSEIPGWLIFWVSAAICRSKN